MHDREKSLRDDIAKAEARLAEIDDERQQLQHHLSTLKSDLGSLQPSECHQDNPNQRITQPSAAAPPTSAEKVALFMKLFRGRDDVFPKRWVNQRKDTKGYSPACSNEWVRGVCDKPRVKCGECPNQAFPPLDGKAVHDHFHGRHIIGVYPMLEDETCWFLAVDFDKGQWQDDVAAFVATCRGKDVPCAVERSGNGAHVWFFFDAPVPAATARKMGCFLLTETMAARHALPMTSYDRFFPNQDTMPRGGFGNLVVSGYSIGP